MANVVVRTDFTKAQAMKLCEEIRRDMTAAWDKAHQLKNGFGYIALGYNTWRECCQQEFQHPSWWVDRKIKAAEVRLLLPTNGVKDVTKKLSPTPQNDGTLLELAKYPEDKRQPILDWATEKADGRKVTILTVRAAAKDVMEGEPEEDEEDVEEAVSPPVRQGQEKFSPRLFDDAYKQLGYAITKIRLIYRDYPSPFHARAKAAVTTAMTEIQSWKKAVSP